MQNDWGALGLGGGVGRVDIRGATPPIGGTGPGGVEGMGLLALLRRLSMGLDKGGGSGLPTPNDAGPGGAERHVEHARRWGPGRQRWLPRGVRSGPGHGRTNAGACSRHTWPDGSMQPPIPVAPSPGGMAGMMATEPGQEDQWAELRRLGVPY